MAYPVEFWSSGIMTFVVSEDAAVKAGLGANTAKIGGPPVWHGIVQIKSEQ